MGNVKVGYLRNRIKNCINTLSQKIPQTKIVWSQILPRLKWRYSDNMKAMEAARVRINSTIATFVIKNGGHYIKYPDILPSELFIQPDGVHLSDLGNNIFLNTLQGALESFVANQIPVFPN